MTSESNQVLDKIKKLLKLSKNNPNMNEASLAAEMAQRLMEKHKIEAAILSNSTGEEEVPMDVYTLLEEDGRSPTMWKVNLGNTIATLNGCAIVFHRGTPGQPTAGIQIIGKAENVSFCMYLFWYVSTTIENLAKEALKRKEGKGKVWSNSFKVGAAEEVQMRLKRAKEQARREAKEEAEATSSTALVRVNNALDLLDNERQLALKLLYQKFDVHRGKSQSHVRNSDAYAAGRVAGSKINLNVRPSGKELGA